LLFSDHALDVTFEDLLAFTTGADKTPPCGFSTKISIEFYDDEHRYPFASTCALSLSLPRGKSNPDGFRTVMFRAIKESVGFGKV